MKKNIILIFVIIAMLGSMIPVLAQAETVTSGRNWSGEMWLETSRLQLNVYEDGLYSIFLIDPSGYKSALYYDYFNGPCTSHWYFNNESTSDDSLIAFDAMEDIVSPLSITDDVISLSKKDNYGEYTLNFSLVNPSYGGGYVKVEAVMKNTLSKPQYMGAITHLDTMVNGYDGSSFELIVNGWRNYHQDFQISGLFRDVPHTTDADEILVGTWNEFISWDDDSFITWHEQESLLNTSDAYITPGINVLGKIDGAAAAKYNEQLIEAGESRTVSFIIGVGPQNQSPILSNTNMTILNGEEYREGNGLPINGTLQDRDEIASMVDICMIFNGATHTLKRNVDLSRGAVEFSSEYTIPSNMAGGEYQLVLFAQDSLGSTSNIEYANIVVALLEQEEPDYRVETIAEYDEQKEEVQLEPEPMVMTEEVVLHKIEMTLGSVLAKVSGKPVIIDKVAEVVDSHALVPLRFVLEALGANVEYDYDGSKINIWLDEKTIEITLGERVAVLNGEDVYLDVVAQAESGRTLLPIRFVSESLGFTVYYDEVNVEIIVD